MEYIDLFEKNSLSSCLEDTRKFISTLHNEETITLYRYILDYQAQLHRRENESFFSKLSHLGSDMDILDVGCGPGAFISTIQNYLSNNVKSYTGIDLEKDFIESASKRFSSNSDYKFVHSDFFKFSGGSFDLLIFWAVLQHLVDIRKSLSHSSALLKRGGHILVLDVAGKEETYCNPQVPLLSELYRQIGSKKDTRNNDCLKELRHLAPKCGFKIVIDQLAKIPILESEKKYYLIFQMMVSEVAKRFYNTTVDQFELFQIY